MKQSSTSQMEGTHPATRKGCDPLGPSGLSCAHLKKKKKSSPTGPRSAIPATSWGKSLGPRAARAPKLSRSSAPQGSALPSPPFHGVWLWGRHEPPALSLLCSRAARSAFCCPRRGWQRFSRPQRCRGSHKPRQRDSHSPPTPAPSPSITQTTQPRASRVHRGSTASFQPPSQPHTYLRPTCRPPHPTPSRGRGLENTGS